MVLGERLGRRGWLALFCATAGVGLKATLLDGFPFVALAIGSSFAFYALIRKRLDLDPFFGDGDRIADDRATGSGADHLLNSDRKASRCFLFSRWHILWYLNGIHLWYNYLCAAGAFPYWQPLSAAICSWFFVLSESVSATPTGTAGLCRTLYKCRYGGLYVDLGSAGSAICPDKMAYIKPSLSGSPPNLSSGR